MTFDIAVEIILKENLDIENTPKALYHSTLKQHIANIRREGLVPRVGELTKRLYRQNASTVIFAADINNARKVYCALSSQIQHIVGRIPNSEEIIQFGAICVITDVSSFKQHTHKDNNGSIETGDYYTGEIVEVSEFLTDDNLIDWIKQTNADEGELCELEPNG